MKHVISLDEHTSPSELLTVHVDFDDSENAQQLSPVDVAMPVMPTEVVKTRTCTDCYKAAFT